MQLERTLVYFGRNQKHFQKRLKVPLSNRTCQTNKKHKDSTSENISTHCTRRDPHFQANSRRRKLLHLIMPHVPLSSSAHRGISSTKRQHQGHALIYIDFFFHSNIQQDLITIQQPDCSLSYSGFFHMYDLGVSCTFHFHKKCYYLIIHILNFQKCLYLYEKLCSMISFVI